MATPKPQMRRKRATGKALWGPWGDFIMDYAQAADTGTATEIFLTGLCKVERLSPNTVRLSWYTRQADGSNLVTLRTIMDITEWLAAQEPLMEARAVVTQLPVGNGKRKDAH